MSQEPVKKRRRVEVGPVSIGQGNFKELVKTWQYSCQGTLGKNEDRGFAVWLGENELLAGVFDGHGGAEASSFCLQNIEVVFCEEFQKTVGSHVNLEIMTQVFRNVFQRLHDSMENEYEKWPERLDRYGYKFSSTAGTTASVVYFRFKEMEVYCANVGDSPIHRVMSDSNGRVTSVECFEEHSPAVVAEAQSVVRRGGYVSSGKHPRVCWKRSIGDTVFIDPFLDMTRALGDFWSYDEDTGNYVVGNNPSVNRFKLDVTDEYVIIMSDGITRDMNEENLNGCFEAFKAKPNCNPAKFLVLQAVKTSQERKQFYDDCCAVVIQTREAIKKSFASI